MAVRQPGRTKERPAADSGKLGKELFGLFTVFCGLLIILGLATFDSRDPWLNHVVSGVSKTHNKAGLFGAYLAGFLYDMVGFAAWIVPVFFCLAGARRILGIREWAWWRWAGFLLLALCASLAGAARDLDMGDFFVSSPLPPGAGNVSEHGGGIVGKILYTGMVGGLSFTGALMVWLFSLLLAVQMITGLSWLTLLKTVWLFLRTFVADLVKKAVDHANNAKICPEPAPVLWKDPTALRSSSPVGQIGGIGATDSLRIGSVDQTPEDVRSIRDGAHELPRDDVTADMERPELFRHTSEASAATTASRSDPPLADMSPLPLPDAAVCSAPQNSLTAGPLSLEPQPSDSRERIMADEDDLPPWVRDFEEDKLGVNADLILSEPFRMPLSVSQPENEDQGVTFSTLAARGEENVSLPMPSFAPDPAVTWDNPACNTSAHDQKRGEKNVVEPETSGGTESVPADSEPPFADLCLKESCLDDDVASEAMDSREHRLPDEAASLAPEPEGGKTGDIRIVEPPTVQAASGSRAFGVLRSALALMKKPSRIPLPPLELLEAVPASVGGMPRGMLEAKGRSLMTCLNDFGIQGELVGITPGPVVTMFEVRPAPGVRVSRIANLNDDLALALKAVAVRIQAPVPGTDTVGVEIPNDVRETVCLKELLGSQLFQNAKSLLTLALGKDIGGEPAVADLASMPHLLVAGATGAGKSVGINSIILSLICKARPEEVKLLLVDPKRVEMAIYAELPHLVHPVVTEMQMAKNALEWAVAEMERRYNAIARASVRNIADYNAKVAAFGDSPPSGLEDLEIMPYLVIIIDELADLMLVAAKEVETSIVRLAQLARAAGIHLILATQRPSVDVVTGLIKANFPCRIAFQVTSKHDSRTILDTVGAEHLLGKGDMLFKPGGGKFRRMHGAFVSDRNVNAVVNYWRSKQKPDYQVDFTDWGQESGNGVLTGDNSGGDIASDPVYNEAVEFVRQQGKASISLIQRKFRIGFNKAARFVEQMERDGIIGPADGSRPRLVIR